MDPSSTTMKRWVIENVDREAAYLARRLAAKYEVRVPEVVMEALSLLDEFLTDGGDIPDGWRRV